MLRNIQALQDNVFLDRAIYRPGQSVYFKGVVMSTDASGIPKILAGEKVTITLFDANGQVTNIDTNYHETTSYAVFGQATWNINDDLSATLGLRFGYEEKENEMSQVTTPVPDSEAPPFGPVISADDDRAVQARAGEARQVLGVGAGAEDHPRAPREGRYPCPSLGFE